MEPTNIGFDVGTKDQTVIALHDRDGCSVIEPPVWAGEVVSMTQFRGELLIACRNGVFRLQGTELVPLRFGW